MKRVAVLFLTLFTLVGCRAPMPRFDMFSPSSSRCVAPPPTGTINGPGTYYNSRTTPSPSSPVNTGFQPAPNNRWSKLDDPAATPIANNESDANPDSDSESRIIAAEDLDVALTSHQTESTVVPATAIIERSGPIRIGQSDSATNGQSIRSRGMPVSGGTKLLEPRRFAPTGRLVNISELPDAPVATTSGSTATRTATSSSSDKSGEARVISGGWRSRTTALRPVGS